jgi:hypothetical protein
MGSWVVYMIIAWLIILGMVAWSLEVLMKAEKQRA